MNKKIILLIVMSLLLSGCGQWNIFKWAHKEGESTDTTVLVADGQSALNNGDYAKAEEIFYKAIQANPRSSEANYGYAQAIIGASGLGLAQIISSVIEQGKSQSTTLPADNPFIHFVSKSFSPEGNLLPFSVNDLTNLYATSKKVIDPLKKIADGQCDGVIPADDLDVNINLSFMLIIRAGCSLLDSNNNGIPGESGDIVKVYSDFTIGEPEISTLSAEQKTTLRERLDSSLVDIGDENSGAIYYLIVALKTIKPEAIEDLKINAQKLKDEITTLKAKL